MPKHIGIVAVSAEGAALCYRTICAEGAAMFGRHNHPEVTRHTVPLATHMQHMDAGRWEDEARLLLESAQRVADAGVSLGAIPGLLGFINDSGHERPPGAGGLSIF